MKKVFILSVLLSSFIFLKSQIIVPNGLVAFYSFNNSFNDLSGNSNNGINYGTTFTENRFGIPNSACNFNGSSYLQIPNNTTLNPTNQISISLWVKVENLTNTYTPILHKGGPNTIGFTNREYILYIADEPAMFIESSGNYSRSYTNYSIPTNNIWFYFVGIIDRVNNKIMIYINGEKKAEIIDNNTAFLSNNYPIKIGAWDETNPLYAQYFKGSLDDIRIYNRVLTNEEIILLYNEIETSIKYDEKINISFSPNPTNNYLLINGLKENSKIFIYDVFGKLVIEEKNTIGKIDIQNLKSGIYILKVINNNEKLNSFRFIKN